MTQSGFEPRSAWPSPGTSSSTQCLDGSDSRPEWQPHRYLRCSPCSCLAPPNPPRLALFLNLTSCGFGPLTPPPWSFPLGPSTSVNVSQVLSHLPENLRAHQGASGKEEAPSQVVTSPRQVNTPPPRATLWKGWLNRAQVWRDGTRPMNDIPPVPVSKALTPAQAFSAGHPWASLPPCRAWE